MQRYDEIGDSFFEELYLALNPDVAAAVRAGVHPDGFSHWAAYGEKESAEARSMRATLTFVRPSQSVVVVRGGEPGIDAGFNALGYLYHNPDVLQTVGADATAARDHWIRHGRAEARAGAGVVRRPLREVSPGRVASRPLGINIFGAFATASGLGTAARATAKAVKVSGLPFELFPFDMTSGEFCPGAGQLERRPRYIVNLILANADTMARAFAAYPAGYFDDAYNIAVWQWELSSPRAEMFCDFEGVDEIWSNSAFQVNAIQAFAPVPVQNVQLPVVAPKAPLRIDRDEFGIPNKAFVFFVAFDVGSTAARKNPLAAIRAFRALSGTVKNIHLVVKYHGSHHDDTFDAVLLAELAGMSSVTLIASRLDLAELDRLRAACDCLVSTHRSEGFGLNIAEFLSLGKAVIATNYSGNTDFFDDVVGFPVEYEPVEIERQSGPYLPGFTWAEPKMASIVEQMGRVVNSPALRAAKAEAASVRIRSSLSLEAVGSSILRRIDELELDHPLPTFARHLGIADRLVTKPLKISDVHGSDGHRTFPSYPMLSILLPVYNVAAVHLRECLESVLQQSYPFWEICICDDGSSLRETVETLGDYVGSSPRIKLVRSATNLGIAAATNRALELACGEYVMFVDNDDVLHPRALEELVTAISSNPRADILYSDENKIDAVGAEVDHFYKPDWSPEHLESVMYLLHLMAVRKSLLLKLGGLRAEFSGAQDYDLALRLSRETNQIVHVSKSLYSWRAIPGSSALTVDAKPLALNAGQRALEEHARQKYGEEARVEVGLIPGTFRLRRPLPLPPGVSLLILTGNARLELPGKGEVSLVENFVASIKDKTEYENYKIVVVDNDTLAPDQIARLSQSGVEIRNFQTRETFNYSAKVNFAVKNASTDHVVLLNDDMEVIRPDWLTALVELINDPGIGAVGARLLHLDGSIQHVGMVMGVHGGATHVYHSYPRDFVGYNGITHVIRNYSAVTGACLATRRSIVAQVGGFDEMLAIDYNDVDFCLRVRAAGYRVAYTPYAELFHYEGVSCKRDHQDPAESARFSARWGAVVKSDPFYNPNLTRSGGDFSRLAQNTAT